MTKVLDNTGLGYLITKMKAAFWPKADVVTVTLADVATTGSYNDLSNKPTIPTVPVTDVTVGGTSVVSSGTAVIPAIPDAVEANPTVPSGTTPTSLTGLKIGSGYYDIDAGGGVPAGGTAGQVLAKKSNADYDTQWVNGGSGSGAVDSVNGKTGTVVLDASDVGALPDDTVIPDAQVNSDWNATSGVAKILNKPDLSGYYSKPSGGIPKTDLASAVQTSLGLADTAVQPEAGKGLFSGNYNDLSNKPTIPTVPTIDTSIDNASSNSDTAGAKAVYDAVHPAKQSSQPAGGFAPNIVYNLGTLSGNTTFALATPADANIVNHYFWTFDTPATAPTITWPAGITSWYGGSAPTIQASKHYEVSVLNGVGIAMEV